MKKIFDKKINFPLIIGICGGSGSGKSEFAKSLARAIGDEVMIISSDNFYKDFGYMSEKERRDVNFDDPSSFNMEELYYILAKIRKDRPDHIAIPTYDFLNYRREKEKKTVDVKKIIICEGLFIFSYEKIRDLFDYRIFIDSASGERLARRLYRDEKLRGRDINDIIERWRRNVELGFQKHIRFTKAYADIVVNSRFEEPIDQPFLQKSLQVIVAFLKYMLNNNGENV